MFFSKVSICKPHIILETADIQNNLLEISIEFPKLLPLQREEPFGHYEGQNSRTNYFNYLYHCLGLLKHFSISTQVEMSFVIGASSPYIILGFFLAFYTRQDEGHFKWHLSFSIIIMCLEAKNRGISHNVSCRDYEWSDNIIILVIFCGLNCIIRMFFLGGWKLAMAKEKNIKETILNDDYNPRAM